MFCTLRKSVSDFFLCVTILCLCFQEHVECESSPLLSCFQEFEFCVFLLPLLRVLGWVPACVRHLFPDTCWNTALVSHTILRVFGIAHFSLRIFLRTQHTVRHQCNRSRLRHHQIDRSRLRRCRNFSCPLFGMHSVRAAFLFERNKWLQENIGKFIK